MSVSPVVRSLILCDRVYRDAQTGKYVLAGVFNTLQAPRFPWVFPGGCAIYCAFSGIHTEVTMQFRFKEATSNEPIISVEIKAKAVDPLVTAELAFHLPPLPLPREGAYSFELLLPDGNSICLPLQASQKPQSDSR